MKNLRKRLGYLIRGTTEGLKAAQHLRNATTAGVKWLRSKEKHNPSEWVREKIKKQEEAKAGAEEAGAQFLQILKEAEQYKGKSWKGEELERVRELIDSLIFQALETLANLEKIGDASNLNTKELKN